LYSRRNGKGENMKTLTSDQVQDVGAGLKAVDFLYGAQAVASGLMGAMVGVVGSAFLTPAGGVAAGLAAGYAANGAFHEIDSLLGL
jgi:uncharacterized membrane protein